VKYRIFDSFFTIFFSQQYCSSHCCSEEKDIIFAKYLRVKCGEWLWVDKVIMYRSEIGNLGDMISTITKIAPEDENPLKLDDNGFVRYHGTQIRKLKTLVNGKLQPNPTSAVDTE
jgi:hypothetical protein